MSDFRKQKDQNKYTLAGRKLYPGLQPETVLMSAGAKIFVDLDGVIVFAYFPYYIGRGTQVS